MPDMEAFAALAEPTRRQILELLARGERSAGELARHFTLSQPAFSQHLRVLRNAGLVRTRQDAQRRMYSIDGRGLAKIDAWLSQYREFWNARFDALERVLQEQDEKS